MESSPSSFRTYFARWALLPTGWQRDVRIEVRTDGTFGSILPSHSVEPTDAVVERIGTVLPGMVNLHSHAFQRAMAGLTEQGGPSSDSFWTWREVMYRFLAELTPDDIEAIAAQLIYRGLEAENAQLDDTLYHDLNALAGTWSDEKADEFRQAIADLGQLESSLVVTGAVP